MLHVSYNSSRENHVSLLIPLILQSCFLVKLSALNKHNHIKKKKKRKTKDKGQY